MPIYTKYFIVSYFNERWFTKEHLTASILAFLHDRGFKTYKEETILSGTPETILFAIGKGYKEIIEIKGYYENFSLPKQQLLKAAGSDQAHYWFSETLFSSLIALVNQYKNKKLPVSLCIPDLIGYREVIQKVEQYFTTNNLHHKIYLVKESGQVTQLNLNKREDIVDIIEPNAGNESLV